MSETTLPASLDSAPVPTISGLAPIESPSPEVVAPAPKPTTDGADSRLLLPDGHWVDFRNPDTLRSGDRKRIARLIDSDATVGSFAVDATDAVLQMLVIGWSYPVKPPSQDPSVLDDLTIEVENAIQGHPYVLAATKMLLPGAEASPTAVSPDPASPTRPSSV